MNKFVRLTEEIFGQHIQYNQTQLEIVQSWIADRGLDPDYAVARIKDILLWRRTNRKDSPKSIVFFEHAFFKRPPPIDKAEEIQRMVKKISNAKKIR